MNAIDLLEQQHREVEALFEKIEEGTNKEESFTKLADSLAAHFSIEEKTFYPAAYKDETEDMLREAVEEHLSIKRVLTDILAVGLDDPTFDAKIKVLQEQDPLAELSLIIDVSSGAGVSEEALERRIVEGLEQLGIAVTWEPL